ncbi:hypothetical protein CCZ27_09185 [Thauera sinica]|nr:hypothetical protein CCZ27_09185 [Thauera sp. K11]
MQKAASEVISAAGRGEVILIDGKGGAQVLAAGANRVPASSGSAYRLLRKGADGKEQLEEAAVVRRAGNDLDITLADGTSLRIEGYYSQSEGGLNFTTATRGGEQSFSSLDAAAGNASADGSIVLYSQGNAGEALAAAANGGSSSAPFYDNPLALLGAVGLAAGAVGLAANSGGGGGGGGGKDAPTPTQQPSTITVNFAAGRAVAALSYEIHDAAGNLLGSGQTDANGQAVLTLTNGYTGPILVRIFDANGVAVADYRDEASNADKPLQTDLRAAAVKGEGNLVVTVTPLTELAVRELGITEAKATASAQQIADINAAIKSVFGVDPSGPFVLVLDPEYDETELSEAELYGQVLAALSGADGASGSMDATLDELAAAFSSIGPVGTLATAGSDLLAQGGAVFESGANADKAELISATTTATAPLSSGSAGAAAYNSAQFGPTLTVSAAVAKAGVTVAAPFAAEAVAGDVVSLVVDGKVVASHMLTLADIVAGYALVELTGEALSGLGQGPASLLAATVKGGVTSSPQPVVGLFVDTAPPSVAITTDKATVKAGETATVTFTFSEAPTDFDAGDVAVSNGTLTGFAVDPENPARYIATFTPAAGLTGAVAAVALTGAYADAVGNPGSTGVGGVFVNTLVPSITVNAITADGAVNAAEKAEGITIGGTSTGMSDGDTVTIVWEGATLTATVHDGAWSVSVPAGSVPGDGATTTLSVTATNAQGNTSAPVSLTVTVDTAAPTLGVSHGTGGAQVSLEEATGSAGVTVVTAESGAAITVTLTGTAGTVVKTYTATGTGIPVILTADEVAELGEGPVAVAVTAVDAIGNSSVVPAGPDVDFVLDTSTTAPTLNPIVAATPYPVLSGTAEPGSSISVTVGGAVFTATAGPDGDWTLDIATATPVSGSYVPPADGTVPVIVTSTDPSGNSETDEGSFTVDTVAPLFTSGATAAPIVENSGAGQVVYGAAAADAGVLTYSLKASGDGAAFSIDGATGEVTLDADPDYETKSSYTFTVIATDAAGNASEQTVTLNVTDVDEIPPTVTLAKDGILVPAAGTTVQSSETGTVYLVHDSVTVSSLADITGAAGDLWNSVAIATANTDTPLALTGLADGTYHAWAVDEQGNLSPVSANGIVVDGTAPVFTSGATATAIAENSGASQTIYTAAATDVNGLTYSLKNVGDHAAFSIDAATGAVTLTANPDYETQSSYSFTVVATDAVGNATEQAVTLAINDIADEIAPTVASVALTSSTGAQNGWLNGGDTVTATVKFSEAVTVDTTGGTPTLTLTLNSGSVQASYAGGSGTDELTFTYTIAPGYSVSFPYPMYVPGDNDDNGIAIPKDAISLGGGTIEDASGNSAVLTHPSVSANASYLVDTTPPGITSSSPATPAYDVPVGGNIVLTFNENMQAGTGNIVITDNNGDERTIAVTDSSQVTISGNTVTINPTNDLLPGATYSLTIADGVLTDLAGNGFSGDTWGWSGILFATDAPPTLASSTPVHSATGVAKGADIVLTFSESVQAGTGNIVIDNGVGDTRTIAITDSSQITISGSTVTINPTTDLVAGTTYTVLVPPSALTDLNGNAFAGLDSGDLAFGVAAAAVTGGVMLSDVAAGSGGFVINGQAAGDLSGYAVSNAGDVNGDGLDDLLVGAYGADTANGTDAGRAYVVFGKTDTTAVNLADVAAGTGGFLIDGQSAWKTGITVSAAGDVNGDGLADFIVGAQGASNGAGHSYVLFGKADTTPIDLSNLSGGGFVITGATDGDGAARVSGAGDVNGDGLADFIVGAPGANGTAGTSYVVFGTTSTAAVDLSNLASNNAGFVINGETAGDYSGMSVSGVGDVNGDGLADFIIGAGNANGLAGRSYVVFGKTDNAAIDLADLSTVGGLGFVIEGAQANSYNGFSVSNAGDVNGDGLADLIVGAPYLSDSSKGRSYVVFGKTGNATVNLSAVEAGSGGGFIIEGTAGIASNGLSVSYAGDFNGDGLADLIVGAPGGTSGDAFVVYGRAGSSAVNLEDVAAGSGGFAIVGEVDGDFAGISVSYAGDVNGDGFADLIVGAHHSNTPGADAGRSYVIFGGDALAHPAFHESVVDVVGTNGDDAYLTVSAGQKTVVAGAGNDNIYLSIDQASVIYAGSGDDTVVITGPALSIFNALQTDFGTPNNLDRFVRIDGGSGIDTLSISLFPGGPTTLDLTQIASQAASHPDGGSRLSSIERIAVGETYLGVTVDIKLTAADVLDISSSDVFAPSGRHALMIANVMLGMGEINLDLADGAGTSGWSNDGTITISSVQYDVWNSTTALATLYVSASITVL